jgi:ribonuclease HIII
VPLLRSLGVDDSKKITDAKIPGMAAEIRKICYGRYKVLSLKPEKYNDLYEKFTSKNWAAPSNSSKSRRSSKTSPSQQVITTGKSFVRFNGSDALRNVAKLHFKTTEEVLR